MKNTALILGSNGRFGRSMALALEQDGWTIRRFDRAKDTLVEAAQDVDVIVNAWNPPYQNWAKEVPEQTRRVIQAAKANDARVLFPGNMYVYGEGSDPVISLNSPQRATNPLGLIRREIEDMYRMSGVKLLILRAGDYIDTEMSGNWYDMIITKPLAKGRIDFPSGPDIKRSWAFLPDLARAGVDLLKVNLPHQHEVLFPGYTMSGADLVSALSTACNREIAFRCMAWWPLWLATPFMPILKGVREMRYLWDMPHGIDPTEFRADLPMFEDTPLVDALAQTSPVKALTHADQPKPTRDVTPAQRDSRRQAT